MERQLYHYPHSWIAGSPDRIVDGRVVWGDLSHGPPYSTAQAVTGRRPAGGIPARCHVLMQVNMLHRSLDRRLPRPHRWNFKSPELVCCAAESHEARGNPHYVAIPAANPNPVAGYGRRFALFISDDSITALRDRAARAMRYQGEARRKERQTQTEGIK
jgi:hypothetical protein